MSIENEIWEFKNYKEFAECLNKILIYKDTNGDLQKNE
jgi:hypothetical protein